MADPSPPALPIDGERDLVNLDKLREFGLPFWLAGGYGRPEQLRHALAAGAAGIQVGTAFAYSEESGLREDYKQAVLEQAAAGTARVFTDRLASPSGFPFKVVQLDGTVSDDSIYQDRPRVCDLGYLPGSSWRTARPAPSTGSPGRRSSPRRPGGPCPACSTSSRHNARPACARSTPSACPPRISIGPDVIPTWVR